MSLIAGGVVTVLGYCTPFMLIGTALSAVGYGLLTTFRPDTPQPVRIGYQIIAGAGNIGVGLPAALMAVQVVPDIADVPTGTAAIVSSRPLAVLLFVSIGQNALQQQACRRSPHLRARP